MKSNIFFQRLTLVSLILISGLNVSGQMLYKLYIGSDNNSAKPTVVHWHQNGSNLWLSVAFTMQTGEDKVYFLQSEINEDHKLLPDTDEQEQPFFSAIHYSAEKMEIEWVDGRSTETLHIATDGSFLPMQLFTRSAMESLISDQPDSPSAVIEATLAMPDDLNLKNLSESVLSYYGCNQSDTDMQQCIQNTFDNFFSQYKELVNIPGEKGPSFQWLSSRNAFVVYNTPQIFGFQTNRYVYTGGAHGMQHAHFGYFDTESQKQLQLTDLFEEDKLDSVAYLLTQKLRLVSNISDNQSLTDAGYFVDLIEPNDNFYLTAHGLGFYYNSYEIAPYAMGHTRIWLSFNDLSALLKAKFLEKLP